jgi:replicative DNA helicase
MGAGFGSGAQGGADYALPQNLDAEISVLGASMLTPNVIPGVSEVVRPHHFYRQAHQTIFAVIEDLFSRGEPVDPITVSEELANRASLEAVGGRAFIHSLVTAVPAATNARQYAEIVRENYYLRSLIKVGGEITEMGYRREHSPLELIDRAEQMVFEISQARVAGEFEPIGDLISESFSELERTMTEGHHTVGCQTGFRDVDALIGGFQPSNLVILAARPSMGKTAFALNVARNVAVDQNKGVAIFSLEMSKMEVVNRMMCSEARVDSWRVRRGMLQSADWSRLAAACTPLHTAPIYIDDSASLNLMEIRAKARRLKAKEKSLGLIIIDYLQLMMGDTSAENRQQEISRISRGLKILARELEVPVMALSQLSRQVEQRAGNRPVLSDLRECVTGDTLVCLADGRRLPIRELAGTQPEVMAMTADGRLTEARSDCVWPVGVRPVSELRTASGQRLRATAEHRVRGGDGWITLGQLRPGNRVAIARRMSEPAASESWPDSEAGSDLFWDTVAEILPAGEEEVFDLTVPGPSCWLADGLVTHNSGAIEQDADLVMFIYRDEVYNRDSPDKGTAEIIVGKQRNGPIGDCKMAFIQTYTRFADLAEKRLPT